MMKIAMFKFFQSTLLIVSFFISCNKEENNRLCDVYLTISATDTPRSTTINSGITAIIDCYGANLCYNYSGIEILQPSQPGPGPANIYDIRAIGKQPCDLSLVNCAVAIFQVRDTIIINTTAAGAYYLRFYNNNSLFKTDTVVVN